MILVPEDLREAVIQCIARAAHPANSWAEINGLILALQQCEPAEEPELTAVPEVG